LIPVGRVTFDSRGGAESSAVDEDSLKLELKSSRRKKTGLAP